MYFPTNVIKEFCDLTRVIGEYVFMEPLKEVFYRKICILLIDPMARLFKQFF